MNDRPWPGPAPGDPGPGGASNAPGAATGVDWDPFEDFDKNPPKPQEYTIPDRIRAGK
jgi:hypothetical protein